MKFFLFSCVFGCYLLGFGEAVRNVLVIESDRLTVCDNTSIADITAVRVIEKDYKFYCNGSVTIKHNIKEPLQAIIKTERMIRGSWVTGEYYRNIKNICPIIDARIEPWTFFFDDFPKPACPFQSKDKHEIKMEEIKLLPSFPPSLLGRWRITIKVYSNKTKYVLCIQFNLEIVPAKF